MKKEVRFRAISPFPHLQIGVLQPPMSPPSSNPVHWVYRPETTAPDGVFFPGVIGSSRADWQISCAILASKVDSVSQIHHQPPPPPPPLLLPPPLTPAPPITTATTSLPRNAKSSSSMDGSLSLPLLRDLESESVSISARLSLSSPSSSGPDHEDLPRLSLDSDKPGLISISLGRNPPRVRLNPKPRPTVDPSLRPCSQVNEHMGRLSVLAATPVAGAGGRVGRSPMRRPLGESTATGPSVDSPRMNSSGKVVFQSLERSSSSPSTFNGGPRVKHRGMERSYSANVVRVTPVLNVPVCSLRGSSKSGSVFGFGQLFSSSPHKKDGAAGASSSSAAARHSSCGSGRSGKIVRA